MSRFYRKPIATLPPRQRSFRKRRPRGPWLVWIFIAGALLLVAWWLFDTDVPRVAKLPDGTIVPVAETQQPAAPEEPAPRVNFQLPTIAPTPSAGTPSGSAAPTAAPSTAAPTVSTTTTTDPDTPGPIERDFRPRPPRDVLEAQIALSRDAICPGSIDGAWGGQTQAAILAFQQKHGLRTTGQLDNDTREKLTLLYQPLTTYVVQPSDFLLLRDVPKGWLERSTLDLLGHGSILEMVAERHWSNPKLLRRLNPSLEWATVTSGTRIVVPDVQRERPPTPVARIVIHLEAKTMGLYDAGSRLLAHFPCSIARRVDKRPVGELEVAVTAPNPNYTFNPETFPDSPEAQAIGRKLILQPGPNNPVGTAWIGLSLPGYGIHGTPDPELVGRTESSGCFRLANWNAQYLLPLVHPGMPVVVEP
jgi:lipoprotein-anchoring transpeptidase ErfK/SrfK